MLKNRLPVVLFLVLVLLLTASPAFALRKISLTPALFEFSAPAGAELSNTFLIENEGDEDISHVFVYSTNVKVDENGKEVYRLPLPEEQVINSPASWVYIKVPDPTKIIGNFPFLSLKKGEARQVDFVIKIPENAPPGDYTTIVFFEARKPETAGQIATQVGARVGCRIRIRVQGEIFEDLSIKNIKVRKFAIGNSVPYEFSLVNSGNVDAPGSVSIRISKGSGEPFFEKVLQKKTYLYAKSNLDYLGDVKVNNLGFGFRNFEVNFKYTDWQGVEKELKASEKFFAIPLVVFYVALVVFASLILFISFYLDARLKKKGKAFQAE